MQKWKVKRNLEWQASLAFSTKWSKAKVNIVFPSEDTSHSKHPLPTMREMTLHMDIMRWSILKSDWLYSLQLKMEKLYTWSDCGSDHELLTAKFRLKLKKVGKATRPFRYGLYQIPYDYTAEVMNQFKGLDLVIRVPEEWWTEVHNVVQEVVIKTIPEGKRNARRQSGCLRRPYK